MMSSTAQVFESCNLKSCNLEGPSGMIQHLAECCEMLRGRALMWGPKTLVLGTNRQDQLLGVLDDHGPVADLRKPSTDPRGRGAEISFSSDGPAGGNCTKCQWSFCACKLSSQGAAGGVSFDKGGCSLMHVVWFPAGQIG